MIGEHSSKQYDHELEAIRSKVLLMGGIVETQFQRSDELLPRRRHRAAPTSVIAEDNAVNQLEVSLDDACSHLIVRRQPTANDLRTVMATIKVITDLERIGDEAAKIARTVEKPARARRDRPEPLRHGPHDRHRHRRHAARRARRLRAPGRQAGAGS